MNTGNGEAYSNVDRCIVKDIREMANFLESRKEISPGQRITAIQIGKFLVVYSRKESLIYVYNMPNVVSAFLMN